MKLNIIKVGFTLEHNGEVVTIFPPGDLPPDSVVVVMDKESWKKLTQELPKSEGKSVYTYTPNQAQRG